jgi:DDE superfamily endonuclease
MSSQSGSESDDDEDDLLEDVVIAVAVQLLGRRNERTPKHDSILTGAIYFRELMNTDNEPRFHESARMDRPTLDKLATLLSTHGGLSTSKGVCYLKDQRIEISVGEKIIMFIHALCAHSNRTIQERWQHSGATVSSIIHEVAESFIKCTQYFITGARENDPVHARLQNPKYREFIRCLGALDGCHVDAVVGEEMIARFRNRKKGVSQNVLGVCDFDMIFSYVLAGWEGSAHDGRVLADAATKHLPLPADRYYLGDAGYALSRFVLTPYRGVRYHLQEWASGNQRPQNKEELFNLRHSSLRNVIERSFGVVKKRFPILVKMSSYPYNFQVTLVRCAFMLHNFIRLNQHYDDEFDVIEDEEVAAQNPAGDVQNMGGGQSAAETARLQAWRDGIAQRMWDDYVLYRDDHVDGVDI